uniref:Transmembrane protein 65 n=1 Tax=Scleropages formosus TaxID=113540 RepID=A0A8C9SGC4_SCLFO
MLPSLRKAMRCAFVMTPRVSRVRVRGEPSTARAPLPLTFVLSRRLGTHPHKEPMEPLNSPRGARDFIYSLHPSERSCLLKELHRFESMAIAQGLQVTSKPWPPGWACRSQT